MRHWVDKRVSNILPLRGGNRALFIKGDIYILTSSVHTYVHLSLHLDISIIYHYLFTHVQFIIVLLPFISLSLSLSPLSLLSAEWDNRIFELDLETRTVQVFMGSEQAGFQNGKRDDALFDTPCGLAMLSNGAILVSEWGNHTIREISPDYQYVVTFAGVKHDAEEAGDVPLHRYILYLLQKHAYLLNFPLTFI
jgi:hypothetical protein